MAMQRQAGSVSGQRNEPGEVLHIPPHVPHKAEAIEDTLDVDIFDPPREDWVAED